MNAKMFDNKYTCICGNNWISQDDCKCDDRCPDCGVSCSPHDELPTSIVQMANLIHSCIDLSEVSHNYGHDYTLLEIIKIEKHVIGDLTTRIVEDWLRGLPSVCTIPFDNHEIEQLCEASGNSHWSIDDYWRWAASRVKAFALFPKAFS